MLQRDRLSLRAFREEEAERERREREARERPIREAERRIDQTTREIYDTIQERLGNQKDDEIYVSPELKNARMSRAEADAFNIRSANAFVKHTPDYFRCDENRDALAQYFKRNGIEIIDESMFAAAFLRLSQYGLMRERPAPPPEPEPQTQPEEPQQQPQMFDGVDPTSGLPRSYTSREVDLMTADEYRRAFQLYGDRSPVFIDPRY